MDHAAPPRARCGICRGGLVVWHSCSRLAVRVATQKPRDPHDDITRPAPPFFSVAMPSISGEEASRAGSNRTRAGSRTPAGRSLDRDSMQNALMDITTGPSQRGTRTATGRAWAQGWGCVGPKIGVNGAAVGVNSHGTIAPPT